MQVIYDKVSQMDPEQKHYLQKILGEDMFSSAKLCAFDAGEAVLEAGETLNHYFFFLSGKLKVFQRQLNGRTLLIQFYTKFDSLGDVELLQDLPVTCTVTALEPSLLLRLEADRLKFYADQSPAFLKHIICSLSHKLRSSDENHAYNLMNPVKHRLASYLLWHRTPSGDILLEDRLQDISEFIGTTYRQLHRALYQLESDLTIQRNGKLIHVVDLNALEKLAGQIYHML